MHIYVDIGVKVQVVYKWKLDELMMESNYKEGQRWEKLMSGKKLFSPQSSCHFFLCVYV